MTGRANVGSMVTVKMWRSFSSNNSSSYYLVARFTEAARAEEVGRELRQLLGELTNAPEQLSAAAGFEWDWSFPYRGGDPSVLVEGELVALYHSNCLGFPPELTAWLRAHGAKVDGETSQALPVSVMFTLPTAGDDLGLAAIFPADGAEGRHHALPWDSAYGQSTFFCDGHTVAFVAPTTPDGLGQLKLWLAEHGVKDPTLRLCEPADFVKFTTMAKARCSGCNIDQPLRYVAPQRYGVDAEQLACPRCGAMFALASLT